ncbi:hypothetical protein M422DRAFT_242273 [Sphaerobolus stellatus SS14]|nr:hypothetical protein M422DRAFT_242273 [Sphaerobolus stellatus SS14]
MSLNGQNQAGVSIEEVNDEDNIPNIVKNDAIKDGNLILTTTLIKATRTYQGSE